MLPFGLQFQKFKPIRKLPMRLESITLEEQKKHYYKIMNIEPKEKEKTKERKVKRNKTKKNI